MKNLMIGVAAAMIATPAMAMTFTLEDKRHNPLMTDEAFNQAMTAATMLCGFTGSNPYTSPSDITFDLEDWSVEIDCYSDPSLGGDIVTLTEIPVPAEIEVLIAPIAYQEAGTMSARAQQDADAAAWAASQEGTDELGDSGRGERADRYYMATGTHPASDWAGYSLSNADFDNLIANIEASQNTDEGKGPNSPAWVYVAPVEVDSSDNSGLNKVNRNDDRDINDISGDLPAYANNSGDFGGSDSGFDDGVGTWRDFLTALMNDDSNYGEDYRNGNVTVTRTDTHKYRINGPTWHIYWDDHLGAEYHNYHDPIWD